MSELTTFLKRTASLTEEALRHWLPQENAYPSSLHRLMRYSIFAGGKRIRPALILAAFKACGGKSGSTAPVQAAAAIEMLHTFSLIHDDLPCMDNDDFRRGKPTAHRAFNEALAVLGGDALCIVAFEVLADIGRADIIAETARALGTNGMIGGQVADIESEGKKVSRETVEYIHEKKTASLIRASVRIGAMLANAPAKTIVHLSSYGSRVGRAFQIVDDILDEEGTTEQLGKDAGSDRERGKATFPAVCGIKESKRYAQDLINKACDDIAFLGTQGAMLRELAEYIRVRIN